jgi:hypothetical protein
MQKFFSPVSGRCGTVAEGLERVHHAGRGRDRVPGADRRAGIDTAEAGGAVAVDQDLAGVVAHGSGAHRQGAGEILLRVVVTQHDGLQVALHQLGLFREGLFQQRLDDLEVDVHQRARTPA